MPKDRRFFPLSWKGFAFEPFQVPDQGVPLSSLNLPADLELLIVIRAGAARALVAREMAYHHVAQGTLHREPYLVSF